MKSMAFVALAGGLLVVTAGHATVHSDGFDRTIPVTRGGTLRVDLDLGEVEVRSHDEDTVRIDTRATGWPWAVEFSLEEDGRDVRLVSRSSAAEGVLAKTTRWALWPFLHPHVDVRAWVPRSYNVEASTAGGGIEIEEVAGDVSVRSGGGRIEVEQVHGNVNVESGGGRIQIEAVGGAVEARSAGGRLSLEEVDGAVVAVTGGGRVFASFAGAPAGTIETGGGRIEIRFPEEAGADLTLRTAGGRVRIADEFHFVGEATPQRWEGAINGGGAPLLVQTSGGRIKIRPL